MRLVRVSAVAALVLLAVPARAAIVDPAFSETVVVPAGPLDAATGMAWAPDGSNRLFVIRQNGEVRIVENGAVLPTPFATVSPIVASGELGLLGIAFDPDFPVSRYVYLFVSVGAMDQQIIRYTDASDVGVDKTILIRGLPTRLVNHNGGGLGVGPDGKLYWGIGDNGAGIGVNDDLTSMAAKIGRANLDGTPVADNPFFDGPGPNADYIWARGFRNPFTLTFQPATGLLWVNVVGTLFEQVFTVRRGDHAGYNLYENNQPDGFITPVIEYYTNAALTQSLVVSTGAVRKSGVVTLTTGARTWMRVGQKITVATVPDPSFNRDYFVTGTPSPTTVTALSTGIDATTGGGTVSTTNVGGCVTGGAFYDATLWPAAYRGNFFFGDYNSGRIERATLDPASNAVTSVDHWATGIANQVDVAVGPEGALYYIAHAGGTLYRADYKVAGQGLVVSSTNVWTAEGQPAVVSLSLAQSPSAPVAVKVARAAGDADVSVTSPDTAVFTGANWNVPQPVTIAAGRDLDTTDDSATIAFSASGLSTENVAVHVRDDNALALSVTPASVDLTEGGTGTFSVALSAQPSLDVAVTVSRASGDSDITVASGESLLFTTTGWSTPKTVTLAAAPDGDRTDDTATFSVAASGMAAQTVTATARDVAIAPVITSTPVLTASQFSLYIYAVQATGSPAPTFTLDQGPAGMSVNAMTGVVSWTAVTAGPAVVTVRASNGTQPDATQTFTLQVAAAGPTDSGPSGDFVGPPDGGAPLDARATGDGAGGGDIVGGGDSGCGCRTGGSSHRPPGLLALLVLPLAALVRRRRRP